MLHTKFQASKPSGSIEDLLIFLCFSMIQPKTIAGGILGPGTFSGINLAIDKQVM